MDCSKDKIMHLMHYDKKFFHFLTEEYEKNYPGKNFFLIRKSSIKDDIVPQGDNILIYDVQEEKDRNAILKLVESCLFAVFHTYDIAMTSTFELIDGHLPVVWCGFGYDFTFFSNIFTVRTWISFIRFAPLDGFKLRLMKSIIGRIKNKRYIKTTKKIQYCGCILPGEYKNIIKYNIEREFVYRVGWNEDRPLSQTTGNKILLAHSRSLTCNHIEGLHLFRKYRLENQKGVMFLNYGLGYYDYIEHVKEYGKKLFGDDLEAYTDFLDINSYETVLKSCSYAIFPYLRQQGLGCINRLFLNGTKIFLYKNSIMYKFFKDYGFTVFSIDHDLKQGSRFVGLSDSEKETNRQKCLSYYGKEACYDSVRSIYNYFWQKE